MRIALAHFKTQTLQHLRSPGYLLPTLAMPGLFHFLFEGPDTEVGLAGPARLRGGLRRPGPVGPPARRGRRLPLSGAEGRKHR